MKIVAILSIHDGSKYLDDLLFSLRFIECEQLKVLFRYDGIDPDSAAILKKFSGLDLIEVNSSWTPIGVRRSYELLLQEASRFEFDFLLFLDQDDVHFPDRVKNISRYDINPARPTILIGRGLVSDENLRVIGITKNSFVPDKSNIFFRNQAIGCLVAINWKGVQELIEHLQYLPYDILHDWGAYLVCGIYGDIILMDDYVAIYRQHSKNAIGYELNSFKIIVRKFRVLFSSKNNFNQLFFLEHVSNSYLSNNLLHLKSITINNAVNISKMQSIFRFKFVNVPFLYRIYYRLRLIFLFLLF